MKLKNQITSFIVTLVVLSILGTGTVLANDYSIYGNEIGTLLQASSNLDTGITVSKLEDFSVYGNGIDTILSDSGRLVSHTVFAGLSDMSIYGETIEAYVQTGLSFPSIDPNFLNRLVFVK